MGHALHDALGGRLVHFLCLGGLIFWWSPKPTDHREIGFLSTTFSALEAAQRERMGRAALRAGEAQDVRTRAIEDEILYREGLRLGFDKADNVVRQRVIQKVLFLAEDLAGVTRPPSEAELKAFYSATRHEWLQPPKMTLIHVYAAAERRSELERLREEVLRAEAAMPGVPPSLGDPFSLPRKIDLTRDELAAQYGESFAREVGALSPGSWSQPVRSKFGWHLVKLLDLEPAGPADFEKVRGKLPLRYMVARKQEATQSFLRQAAARYRITVDGVVLTNLPPSIRSAPDRSEAPD